MKTCNKTHPWSSLSTGPPGPIIAGCPGPIGPAIGCPGPNGLPGGIPYCGPPNGWPCEGKCGLPAPGGTNGGPEEPGRPTNCGGAPDGDPNGLGPGPLYGGPEFVGGGGKPVELGGGPGPGVEEPLGAGEAVYCGVAEPGGGP